MNSKKYLVSALCLLTFLGTYAEFSASAGRLSREEAQRVGRQYYEYLKRPHNTSGDDWNKEIQKAADQIVECLKSEGTKEEEALFLLKKIQFCLEKYRNAIEMDKKTNENNVDLLSKRNDLTGASNAVLEEARNFLTNFEPLTQKASSDLTKKLNETHQVLLGVDETTTEKLNVLGLSLKNYWVDVSNWIMAHGGELNLGGVLKIA